MPINYLNYLIVNLHKVMGHIKTLRVVSPSIAMTKSILLSAFLLILLTSNVHPSTTTSSSIEINDYTQRKQIGEYILYYEDKQKLESFSSIKDLSNDKFTKNSSRVFHGGFSDSTYWLKLSIDIDSLSHQNLEDYILVIDFPPLNKVSLYTEHSSGWKQKTIGAKIPFYERTYKNNPLVFDLHLLEKETGTNEIFLSVESSTVIELPIEIWDRNSYFISNSTTSDLWGLYFGAMIVMLMYNLIILIITKDKVYIHYILYLSSMTLLLGAYNGYSYKYLWPNSPDWNELSLTIVTSVTLFFATQFARAFLHTKELSKALDKSLNVFGYFNLTPATLAIATLENHIILVSVFATLVTFLLLYAGFYGAYYRKKVAYFFLIAWSFLLSGICIYLLNLYNLIEHNRFTVNAIHIGSVLEVMLLSLGLADRINTTKKEYKSLYENSVEGRFQYFFKSKSIICNQSFCDMLGFTSPSDPRINEDFLETAGEQTYIEIKDMLEEKGVVSNYVAQLQNEDNPVWLSINIRSLRDHRDIEYGIEGTLINVSEKVLKEEAEKQNLITMSESKAKNQFYASMSHELRTPLTAVLGYAELAKDPFMPEEERIEKIKTIEKGGKHLLQLINDTLDLSKIEAQKIDIELIDTDILNLLKDIYENFEIIANKKKITFNIEVDYPIPITISTDPTRLKQILINLCGNSIKFTEQGHVTVKCIYDQPSNLLLFHISDTGIGIKQTQLENLFNAYSQADASTTRNYGGTGLGLHLSKKLALMLGGDIEVKSEYGKGSTFTLSASPGEVDSRKMHLSPLPLFTRPIAASTIEQKCATESANNPEQTKTTRESDKRKILLVEDNKVNQQLISFHLQKTGSQVIIANDGAEAIAEVLKERIDLIFMDISMPHLDGLQTLSIIRSKGIETPIYLLTANNDIEDELSGNDSITGFLYKPIDAKSLLKAVDSVADLNQSQQHAS